MLDKIGNFSSFLFYSRFFFLFWFVFFFRRVNLRSQMRVGDNSSQSQHKSNQLVTGEWVVEQ